MGMVLILLNNSGLVKLIVADKLEIIHKKYDGGNERRVRTCEEEGQREEGERKGEGEEERRGKEGEEEVEYNKKSTSPGFRPTSKAPLPYSDLSIMQPFV